MRFWPEAFGSSSTESKHAAASSCVCCLTLRRTTLACLIVEDQFTEKSGNTSSAIGSPSSMWNRPSPRSVTSSACRTRLDRTVRVHKEPSFPQTPRISRLQPPPFVVASLPRMATEWTVFFKHWRSDRWCFSGLAFRRAQRSNFANPFPQSLQRGD